MILHDTGCAADLGHGQRTASTKIITDHHVVSITADCNARRQARVAGSVKCIVEESDVFGHTVYTLRGSGNCGREASRSPGEDIVPSYSVLGRI